jgi:hypothetical protein
VLRKIGIALCCGALFVLGGGHWAALQSVAWTRMIVDYSKGRAVSEAVAMTFSGQNPCEMCKGISKGKSEEKQQQTVKNEKKLETSICQEPGVLFLHTAARGWNRLATDLPDQEVFTPPYPPPRIRV